MFDMKRRDFMILLGAAAAWPRAARAQQSDRVRRVGVLMGIADDPEGRARVMVFRQALQALGWTEGRNVQFIYRWSRAAIASSTAKSPATWRSSSRPNSTRPLSMLGLHQLYDLTSLSTTQTRALRASSSMLRRVRLDSRLVPRVGAMFRSRPRMELSAFVARSLAGVFTV